MTKWQKKRGVNKIGKNKKRSSSFCSKNHFLMQTKERKEKEKKEKDYHFR